MRGKKIQGDYPEGCGTVLRNRNDKLENTFCNSRVCVYRFICTFLLFFFYIFLCIRLYIGVYDA